MNEEIIPDGARRFALQRYSDDVSALIAGMDAAKVRSISLQYSIEETPGQLTTQSFDLGRQDVGELAAIITVKSWIEQREGPQAYIDELDALRDNLATDIARSIAT